MLTGTALGGTLKGRVLGANQMPKPFVRIEIGGRTAKTLFSGRDGQFQIKLPKGRYKVLVYEQTRGARFTVDVPANGVIKRNFVVGW